MGRDALKKFDIIGGASLRPRLFYLFRNNEYFHFSNRYVILSIMEPDLTKKIEEIERKVDAVYKSVEKTRKYFLWTLIITLVTIVLPLIALAFLVPYYIKTISPGNFGL